MTSVLIRDVKLTRMNGAKEDFFSDDIAIQEGATVISIKGDLDFIGKDEDLVDENEEVSLFERIEDVFNIEDFVEKKDEDITGDLVFSIKGRISLISLVYEKIIL